MPASPLVFAGEEAGHWLLFPRRPSSFEDKKIHRHLGGAWGNVWGKVWGMWGWTLIESVKKFKQSFVLLIPLPFLPVLVNIIFSLW